MKDQKKNQFKMTIPVNVYGFVILLFFISIAVLSFAKIEVQAEGTCNTGFVGIDIEANNLIQNKTCMNLHYDPDSESFEYVVDKEKENLTCFKEDLLLDHVKLKNIDGMNCYGKTTVKLPYILALFS